MYARREDILNNVFSLIGKIIINKVSYMYYMYASHVQGYSLQSTFLKEVSKLGCRVVFLKYLSMERNSFIESAD